MAGTPSTRPLSETALSVLLPGLIAICRPRESLWPLL